MTDFRYPGTVTLWPLAKKLDGSLKVVVNDTDDIQKTSRPPASLSDLAGVAKDAKSRRAIKVHKAL